MISEGEEIDGEKLLRKRKENKCWREIRWRKDKWRKIRRDRCRKIEL